MRALGKVERATVGLVDLTIGLFWVDALSIVKEYAIEITLVVVGFDEVKLGEGYQHMVFS